MTRLLNASALAGLMIAVATGGAAAQSKSPFNNSFNNTFSTSALNVFIGCRIENLKEIVLTNSTGGTIAAGTVINWDAVRYRSTSHYGGSVVSPLMTPGASMRLGGEQSSSCTAWYRRPAVRAP
jgi:hypothetical protein